MVSKYEHQTLCCFSKQKIYYKEFVQNVHTLFGWEVIFSRGLTGITRHLGTVQICMDGDELISKGELFMDKLHAE